MKARVSEETERGATTVGYNVS